MMQRSRKKINDGQTTPRVERLGVLFRVLALACFAFSQMVYLISCPFGRLMVSVVV